MRGIFDRIFRSNQAPEEQPVPLRRSATPWAREKDALESGPATVRSVPTPAAHGPVVLSEEDVAAFHKWRNPVDAFKMLLEKGADPNDRFPATDGHFPNRSLAQAALLSGGEAFKMLLEKGADPNVRFPSAHPAYPNLSLAQAAFSKGDLEAFRMLLKKGAHLTTAEAEARFPPTDPYYPNLSWAQVALLRGHVEAFKVLVEKGAHLTTAEAEARFSPTHPAYPNLSLAQVALVDGKIQSKKGAADLTNVSLAQVVLLKGDMEAFRILLKEGAHLTTEESQVFQDQIYEKFTVGTTINENEAKSWSEAATVFYQVQGKPIDSLRAKYFYLSDWLHLQGRDTEAFNQLSNQYEAFMKEHFGSEESREILEGQFFGELNSFVEASADKKALKTRLEALVKQHAGLSSK